MCGGYELVPEHTPPNYLVPATEKPERSERGEKQELRGCRHGQASPTAHCYPLSCSVHIHHQGPWQAAHHHVSS